MILNDSIRTKIVQSVKDAPHLVQIWLFGSFARGTATCGSDIDLLMVHDEDSESVCDDEVLLFDATNSLQWLTRPPYCFELDLIPCSIKAFTSGFDGHFGGSLIDAVHKEGVLLYDKSCS